MQRSVKMLFPLLFFFFIFYTRGDFSIFSSGGREGGLNPVCAQTHREGEGPLSLAESNDRLIDRSCSQQQQRKKESKTFVFPCEQQKKKRGEVNERAGGRKISQTGKENKLRRQRRRRR